MDPDFNMIPTLMANKEEGNSEVGSSNCNTVSMNLPYYLSACSKNKTTSKTSIDSLLDELVLEILVHLQAEDIFEAAMLVCRKWYNIIHTHNFVRSHLHRSNPGLFIHHTLSMCPTFVSMVQGKIEISKMDYKFVDECWSSCNGLTLVYSPMGDWDGLCIANAVTKQLFRLPEYGNFYVASWNYSAIAYAAASMDYKVIRIFKPNDLGNTPVALLGCAICTVGVDKSWRHVDIQHLSLEARELFTNTPLTTEGFLHWTSREVGTRILTLNVETEVITEICVPIGCNSGGQESRYYLSNGRSLTVLISCGVFSWDVWELKKPENGEWVKMFRIDLEGHKWELKHFADTVFYLCPMRLTLEPVGWLNYYEGLAVQVCRPAEGIIVYNVDKQEMSFLEMEVMCNSVRALVHKNSLVGLDGRCY